MYKTYACMHASLTILHKTYACIQVNNITYIIIQYTRI